MLKHKRINSFLPVFNGFYSTVFEASEDNVIESPFTFENYEFDYSEYNLRVSKACVNAIENKLKDLDFVGITIEFENLVSPKEYNFANDSINVKYKLTTESIKGINTYLKANIEAFDKYITDNYTSRSGFISSYSNLVGVWFTEYLSDKNKLSHVFGAVLQFIFDNEGYDSFELYSDIDSETYLEGTLKNGVGEIDNTINEYAKENYKTKDILTIVCELVKHFDVDELSYFEYVEHEFLTFDYIENKVQNVFNEIENKTLDLFAVIK